jgi:hypothetical protein
MNKRTIVRTAVITSIALAATLIAAGPANASAPTLAHPGAAPAVAVGGSYFVVIDDTHVSNYTDKSILIGRCDASKGASCSISSQRQATVSIDVGLGITRELVASSLDVTASSSVTLTLGCTLSKATSSEVLSAYPIGRYFSYKVQQWSFGVGIAAHVVATTGTLHAFVPYTNQISCIVS